MKSAALLASVSALLSTPALAAAAPVTLLDGSTWKVDYGLGQCTAARSYATPAGAVVLGLVPSLDGNRYKLLISVPQPGPAFAQQSRGTVDFGRGGISSPTLFYGAEGVPLSVHQFEVSAAQLEQARSAGSVNLRSADGANFTFALSNMSNLLDGLRACTGDLQRYWNANSRAPVRTAQSRTVDVRTLFTPADFPSQPSYGNAPPLSAPRPTAFRLLVDERGSVDGCDPVSSSGNPLLETSFCDKVRAEAHFVPAATASGQPIRSIVTTGVVNWGYDSELNTGCSWVTGTSFGVVNFCGARQQPVSAMPMFTPAPTTTAPTPPSPSSR